VKKDSASRKDEQGNVMTTYADVVLYLRAVIIGTAVLALTACGGGGGTGAAPTPAATFTIGGTLSGLSSGSKITLLDNATNSLTISSDGSFTFAARAATGAAFAVTVGTAPGGQICTVSNGSGTVASANVTSIGVICVATTFTLGGTLSGLAAGAQLILLNNGADALTLSTNGAFTFAPPVVPDTPFSVTVGTAPTGQTCRISNGTDRVYDANVTNVAVVCAATSAGTVLLELGHAATIELMQMTTTRALSEDATEHWVLWNLATDTLIVSGTSGCLSSSCTAGLKLNNVVPVALVGGTIVIETASALEIHAALDGHLMAAIPGSIAWWKLASDGTYVVTGSTTSIQAWSLSGKSLFSLPGDYSTANAFLAPGQLQVANGPAGQNVIQTIATPAGTSTVGPTFLGQFNNWFLDGSHFQTNTGSSVWTYSNTSVQQDLTTASSQGLTGSGNWFWVYVGNQLSVYAVGASATPSAVFTSSSVQAIGISSGTIIGLVPENGTSLTIVDVSGTAPTSSTYKLPNVMSSSSSFAAASSSQWLLGNASGVVFDGTSSQTTAKYLSLGTAESIAGGGGIAAIATASGQIITINPQTMVVQNKLNLFGSQVEMSSDGTVLAVNLQGSIGIYSLPAGTLTTTFSGTADYNFSLAASGTVLAYVNEPYGPAGPVNYPPVAVTIPGGSTILSPPVGYQVRTDGSPLKVSPDGSLIAVYDGNGFEGSSATTGASIYQNGTLVGAVTGEPEGWIDDGRLLVNTYSTSGSGGLLYSGCTISSPAGATLSSPALPELTNIQPVTTDTVYAPNQNGIFSLTTGVATWESGSPSADVGAVVGPYVVYLSESQILAAKY